MAEKKRLFIGIAVAILLLFAYLGNVSTAINKIAGAFYPIFIGALFALTLDVPIKLCEEKIFFKIKTVRIRRLLSLILVLIITVGAIVGVILLLENKIKEGVDVFNQILEKLKTQGLNGVFGESKLYNKIYENAAKLIDGISKAVVDAIASFSLNIGKLLLDAISALFGLLTGCLALIYKDNIKTAITRLILLFADKKRSKKIMAGVACAIKKFSGFLAGSLIESAVFGVACYLMFSILRLPNALLLAPILAILNLIPTFGAYLGGVVGVVVVVSLEPSKALLFLGVYFVLQQLEQFTTYPLIVGKYVGIDSFMVFTSVIVGGGLFGFWGLILAVPIVAFIDNLIKAVKGARDCDVATNKSPNMSALR